MVDLFSAVGSYPELKQNSDTQFPTLLHYAAAYGMFEFSAALLECPGSSRAYRIRNSDGLNPAELAAQGGFGELENYIIDFMVRGTVFMENYIIDFMVRGTVYSYGELHH